MGGPVKESEVASIGPSLATPAIVRRRVGTGAVSARKMTRPATVRPRIITARVPVARVQPGQASAVA